MLKFYNDAKLRAGTLLREMKEKREERKAARAAVAHSEHGHGRFFLLTVPATATICAAIVEVYWAVLFCIEATGHLAFDFSTAIGSEAAASGAWNFAFVVNSVAVLIGLTLATIPIVMISMVWLPVQFTMRGTGRWRRGTMIFCGILANVLVIVSGTVVMNGNRQEQVRESVVVEQTAAQGRAAIDARLAFEQEQLRLALANANPYLNQAANVGAAEWERSYVAQARATNDPRLPQLERALGAARAADERRANIERLTIERATAAPEAATAATVEDTAGQPLNQFSQAVQVWRPPFVAFICTLVGIFGAWWTLALMQGLNPRDVLRSGWAPESHRIEDLREEESATPQPMRPAREVVTDAETGEELIRITPKPHWRKQKGKKQRVETQPDIPPDETGFTDARTATAGVTLAGRMDSAATEEVASEEKRSKANHDDRGNDEPEQIDQSEPPIDFEELAAQVGVEINEPTQENDDGEAERTADESGHETEVEVHQRDGEDEAAGTDEVANVESHTEEPRQPEQREDRMLAPPSVAAE